MLIYQHCNQVEFLNDIIENVDLFNIVIFRYQEYYSLCIFISLDMELLIISYNSFKTTEKVRKFPILRF